jgi:hypothetical protein
VQFLPTYPLIDGFVNPLPKPFDVLFASMIYLIPFLALILATLLLYDGLTLIKQKPTPGSENGAGRNLSSHRTGWMSLASLILSGLLYGSSFYNLYWQFLWDSTTDSWDIFLLFGPFIAVLVSGVLLSGTLRGRNKLNGLLYTVLLAAVILTVYTQAKQIDYYQLTESHAAQVSLAIETYFAREGRYPQNLRQIVPWTMLSLPKPVIINGQHWCYQSGDGYYRLGYVSRDHWSSPYLSVRVYKSVGMVPGLPELCEAEIKAMIAREPMFSVIE